MPDPMAAEAEREPLFESLRKAKSEREGRARSRIIWDLWYVAPDMKAQTLLDRGVRKIREADYAGAQRILSELVEYCPLFPEGWNQRAFARFLADDLDGSLEDLDRTLQLEPRHFGALAGRGLT